MIQNNETFFFKKDMEGGTQYRTIKNEELFKSIENIEETNSEEISGISLNRDLKELNIWVNGKSNFKVGNLQEIEKAVLSINDLFLPIEEGEISAIVAYKYLKNFDGIIKNALKLIEGQALEMIEASPLEHKEFRISARKTYDFKSSDYYNQKLEELKIEENKEKLKEVEKLIKTATDMDKTLYDDNGEAIEKVEIKFKQILTYTPKKK